MNHTVLQNTHNLKLNRHKSKVDHLHSGPDQVIRFQGRHIDVSELAKHISPVSALCNRHECEKYTQTCLTSVHHSTRPLLPLTDRRIQQLIKRHTFRGSQRRTFLSNRKCVFEETIPSILHECDQETMRHESREALKVECRRRCAFRVWGPATQPRALRVQLVDLDVDAVVFCGW